MKTRSVSVALLLVAGVAGLSAIGGPPVMNGQTVPAVSDTLPDVSRAAKSRVPAPQSGDSNVSAGRDRLATGASAFVPIAPFRSYDSRNDPSGKWLDGEFGLIEVITDEFGDPVIPANATAVTFNVTVARTGGTGYVQIYGPGTQLFSTSTLNWVLPNFQIANGGSVALSTSSSAEPGFMGVALGGGAGAEAHILIDITGYYEPIAV